MSRSTSFQTGLLLAISLATASCFAQDVVILRRTSGPKPIRLEGTIVDLTGETLVIRLGAGRDDKYPADRILDLQTAKTHSQQQAEIAVSERRWGDALPLLHRAATEDRRTWMRRQLIADLSLCYLNTGNVTAAVENFSGLYQSDPTTTYFPRIPLAWAKERANPETLQQANRWLSDPLPVKRLMGASWLLNSQPETAVGALQGLLTEKDPRLARMAEAQTWRTQLVLADAREVGRWESRVRTYPPAERCGPAFVVGRAWNRLGQYEDAATAMMRSPIEHPELGPLASAALLNAAGALEKLGQTREAQRLYLEITTNYGRSDAAQSAKSLLSNRNP